MDDTTRQELNSLLKAKQKRLEEQLAAFAVKDRRVKGDYDAIYPAFATAPQGPTDRDAEEDEVEEYETRLAVEHTLERELAAVSAALARVAAGSYGRCTACGNEIAIERLKALPEAETCGCT